MKKKSVPKKPPTPVREETDRRVSVSAKEALALRELHERALQHQQQAALSQSAFLTGLRMLLIGKQADLASDDVVDLKELRDGILWIRKAQKESPPANPV